jgi:hypothetical protein
MALRYISGLPPVIPGFGLASVIGHGQSPSAANAAAIGIPGTRKPMSFDRSYDSSNPPVNSVESERTKVKGEG